jgi:hypothetical protein
MAQYAPRVDSVTLPKLRAVFRAVPATSGAAEFGGDRHEDGSWEFRAEFDAVFKQFDRRREHALVLGGFLCACANKRGQRRISERSRMRGVKGESGDCHGSSAGKGRLNGRVYGANPPAKTNGSRLLPIEEQNRDRDQLNHRGGRGPSSEVLKLGEIEERDGDNKNCDELQSHRREAHRA